MGSISKIEKRIILLSAVGGVALVGFGATTSGVIFNANPAVMFTGFICGVGGGALACLCLRVMKK